MLFTCITCGLNFETAADQRAHMKADWHRYNLKRRVAQLPPIDEDMFVSKVAAMSLDGESETPSKKPTEKQMTKKEQRRKEKEVLQEQKRHILEMAKKAMHAQSKANDLAPIKVEESLAETVSIAELNDVKSADAGDIPAPVSEATIEPLAATAIEPTQELSPESVEEQLIAEKLKNAEDVSPLTCIFSDPKYNKTFDTVEENIDHMWHNFGLYIPEPKYLIDKEGLIKYLAEKVSFGFCICCNYQGRNSEAARAHMKSKRHTRIPYESEDEKLEISEFYDFSSTYDVTEADSGNEDNWEDVSGDEGEDSGSDDDLPPIENNALYHNGTELILPSGAVIGHRSMARYYRQNLPPDRELTEGQGTVIAAETRHAFGLADKHELALQKRVWHNERKSVDQFDRKAKKFINNQPHFRDPLLQ